jgi:uncharacterized membrane protein YhhN
MQGKEGLICAHAAPLSRHVGTRNVAGADKSPRFRQVFLLAGIACFWGFFLRVGIAWFLRGPIIIYCIIILFMTHIFLHIKLFYELIHSFCFVLRRRRIDTF